MQKKPRILLFSKSSRSAKGGVELIFQELTNGLSEKGYDVYQIYQESKFYSQPDKKIGGIPLPPIRTWKKFPLPGSLFSFTFRLVKLFLNLQTIRPAVVHCHFVDPHSLYFALLKHICHYKLLLTGHGSDFLRLKDPYALFWVPKILRQADFFTAVSHAVEKKALSLAPFLQGRTKVIPNGCDVSFWYQERKEFSLPPLLLAVGRLEEVKGYDILIRAIPNIKSFIPNIRVCIIGEGTGREFLMKLAREAGVKDCVQIMGWQDAGKLREYYHRATLLIVPSRSEGFGSVILEGMASGLPIIASNVGGIPEIIESGKEGILVPPENVAELAQVTITLLQNENLQKKMQQNCMRKVKSFSWENTLAHYENVIQTILS